MTTTQSIPTTPQAIATDARFQDPKSGLFNLLAEKVGMDDAGILWIQACLYTDQVVLKAA